MGCVTQAEVLWFNEAKGYGLARPESLELDDIKIKKSSLTAEGVVLMRGDRVEVVFKQDLEGLVAEEVKVIESVVDRGRRIEKLAEFARRMPKVNLHVHLEGAISSSTLFAIAERNGYDELGVQDAEELTELFKVSNFFQFIEMYSLCSNALRTSDDYTTITYEYLRKASQQNIRYVEAYFSPYDRMKRGLEFEQIVEGVSKGRERALEEFGIRADFVVDVGRHLLWTDSRDPDSRDPELAKMECLRLVELAASSKEQGIVGFSLGGKEVDYPVHPFADAFECARQMGLHTKAHSGEAAPPKDTWDVIKVLRAERIGNAVRASEDRTLVRYIADNHIPLEMCPTANVLTGASETLPRHPLRYYLEEGIQVTIGSDDPALFNTTLTKEYQLAVEHFNFSTQDLQKLVFDSIEMSWLSSEEKAALCAAFEDELKQLHEELGI